jgi:hypothetical protein
MFVMVFIDDILVYSKSEEEHEEYLRLVLQKLQDHRLYAMLNECVFWLKQAAFLGHIISRGGIFIDPSKVQDVLSWICRQFLVFSWIGWILSKIY